MSNELVNGAGNSLPVSYDATDPFTALAVAEQLKGRFLKYAKSRWTTGTGKDEVPMNDAELIADIANVALGWRRWEDHKPVEHRIGLLKDRYVAPQRNDLGHLDQSEWPRDNKGEPADPWQFGWHLRLVDPATGDNFVWSAGSGGGIKELEKLGAKFAKQRAIDPGRCTPLVQLATDGYTHRTYGWVPTPVLKIVKWLDNGDGAPVAALPSPDGSDDANDLNDDLPF